MGLHLIGTAAFSVAPESSGDGGGTTPDQPMPRDKAARYEIEIVGLLDSRWNSWFGGLLISHTADGNTILSGVLPDQAALHGVLERIRDLNLVLISVHRLTGTADDAGHRQDRTGG